MNTNYQNHTSLMQQYLNNKEQCMDAFMFFRIGDFYEFFFDDAIHASKVLGIHLTKRSSNGDAPMCGIPNAHLNQYIPKLIKLGYKVAICEQVEDPSMVTGRNLVKREIVKIITPGTATFDESVDQDVHNYIACISKPHETFGLSICDLTTGEFSVTEIIDDVDKLLSELSSYYPTEIVIDDSIKAYRGLVKTIKYTLNPAISYMESKSTYANYLETMFDKLPACPYTSKHTAGMLHNYLSKTQRNSLPFINKLNHYVPNEYMVLDTNTRKNLELVKSNGGEKLGSLLWAIDMTETPMGSRLLRHYINKPCINQETITERLDAVEYLAASHDTRHQLKAILTNIQDLERITSRAAYNTANARDIMKIALALECVPEIKTMLMNSKSKLLERLATSMHDNMDLVKQIKLAIVQQPPVTIKEGGVIRNGYNSELDEYRKVNLSGSTWLSEYQDKLSSDLGIKNLKVKFMLALGYYIEIPKTSAYLIPKDQFERIQELTNVCRYRTAELTTKEQIITKAETSINDLEYELFLGIRKMVNNKADEIKEIADAIAQVDVLQSFAECSIKNNYVRPIFTENTDILYIEKGRHPMVEQSLHVKSEYICNDTVISDKEKMILITGPNMAGKSTYMRQVAIISLMAHLGSFVPADKVILPIVDRIFTRIGASDNLYGGESTFMVEMKDIKTITDEATERSLVIIDELGRGTSVTDGMSIAKSVIEYLHGVGSKTLVSTHYYELASLHEVLPKVTNYNLAVSDEGDKITFLHKLEKGAASSSYGIYCAELAGIRSHIVDRAKQIAVELHLSEGGSLPKHVVEVKEEPSLREVTPTSVAIEPSVQFDMGNVSIIETLKNLDIGSLTPVDALVMLNDLRKRAK